LADSITAEELKALMNSDRKPAVFDVGRPADFDSASQKIESAVWGDPEEIYE